MKNKERENKNNNIIEKKKMDLSMLSWTLLICYFATFVERTSQHGGGGSHHGGGHNNNNQHHHNRMDQKHVHDVE